MYRFSTDQDFVPGFFPDPLPAVDPVGLSGYLFFGRNSSFPHVPSANRSLNLDGLPTTFGPLGFHFVDLFGVDAYFESPLATFLLCDPRARILDGQVVLSPTTSSITVISASSPKRGELRVGNIPTDAAGLVLGLGQLETLSFTDGPSAVQIGVLASRAFLNDTSLNFDPDPSNPFDVGILSLEDIQRNLDTFMNSSAKAFSSYVRDFSAETSDLFLVTVQAATQQNELALVTSHGLLISTICLFFGATTLIVVNFFYFHIWRAPPFKIETLIGYIREKMLENEKWVFFHFPRFLRLSSAQVYSYSMPGFKFDTRPPRKAHSTAFGFRHH